MSPFERWSVWLSSVLCGGTGVAYFLVKYLMEPSEPWAVINHPIQPWLLKAHIVTAPLLVFALGAVAGNHFWKHYRSGVPTGRRSGVTAMLSVAPMVLTGVLIQAVTSPGWLKAMAVAHIAFGALYLGGLALHQKVFRSRRRTAPARGELPVLPGSGDPEGAEAELSRRPPPAARPGPRKEGSRRPGSRTTVMRTTTWPRE